jgi:formate hydrogenlyase subunit 6/NADH:ubiquinone oxidoreductase subunit I
MKTEIYYFSTTGSSLVIARDIAQKTKGKLTSIPSTKLLSVIDSNAEILGIVFPVYHATFGENGFPHLVEEFIKKIANIDKKYIFAICTHSGYPGFTIENLNELFKKRGGKLSAGLDIRTGYSFSTIEKINYILFNKSLNLNIEKERLERKKLIDKYKVEVEAFCKIINRKEKLNIRNTNIVIKSIKKLFLSTQKQMVISRYKKLSGLQTKNFRQLLHNADNSFSTSNQCNGCGICQIICPVDNIIIVDGKPKWLNKCENCYACYQWCPQEAITGEIIEFEKRYHHPDVTIADMIATL